MSDSEVKNEILSADEINTLNEAIKGLNLTDTTKKIITNAIIKERDGTLEKKKEKNKEYYQKNKNIILEKNKEYREKNREIINEKKKEYRKNNKDKIAEYEAKRNGCEERKKYKEENRKIKITCECGVEITKGSKSRHLKSSIHQMYLKHLDLLKQSEDKYQEEIKSIKENLNV